MGMEVEELPSIDVVSVSQKRKQILVPLSSHSLSSSPLSSHSLSSPRPVRLDILSIMT